MRLFLKIFFAYLILIFSSQTIASQDGSFYLQSCSAAVKQSDGVVLSPEDGLSSVFCIGYVSGFLEANALLTTENAAVKAICTPENGITNDQAIRIFVKYLRENPEYLHQSGRMSLYVSLAKAFPCLK